MQHCSIRKCGDDYTNEQNIQKTMNNVEKYIHSLVNDTTCTIHFKQSKLKVGLQQLQPITTYQLECPICKHQMKVNEKIEQKIKCSYCKIELLLGGAYEQKR